MVNLKRVQFDVACEHGVRYPVIIDACEEIGLGIQADLQSHQYLLVSLKTGYALVEDGVFSYFQARYWLERILALSQQQEIYWNFSVEEFSTFSSEERERYEHLIYKTLEQARAMPKDLLC